MKVYLSFTCTLGHWCPVLYFYCSDSVPWIMILTIYCKIDADRVWHIPSPSGPGQVELLLGPVDFRQFFLQIVYNFARHVSKTIGYIKLCCRYYFVFLSTSVLWNIVLDVYCKWDADFFVFWISPLYGYEFIFYGLSQEICSVMGHVTLVATTGTTSLVPSH